jgi:hypothetical protein
MQPDPVEVPYLKYEYDYGINNIDYIELCRKFLTFFMAPDTVTHLQRGKDIYHTQWREGKVCGHTRAYIHTFMCIIITRAHTHPPPPPVD